MSEAQQKRVFVVLGMARTGTSAISRALKVFGIHLGDALTTGNADWNPTGFWEDKDIVYGLNGKLFSRLDFAPYGLLTIPDADQTDSALDDIHHSAAAILRKRLQSANCFGFKDPSTIKVLPFWRKVFTELKLRDDYVIALRNPLAAARSYQKLTGCELELCLLLWCAHLLQAVEGTAGSRRLVVSYDLLLQNPRHQLQRIGAAFDLGDADAREEQDYAEKFLDQKLNRFQVSHDAFSAHEAVCAASLCKDLYESLLKVARDEWSFESTAFIERWQSIKKEYEKLYPLYCYLDHVLKQRRSLKRALRDAHKSWLWKLLSPLHRIDSYWRERRRKLRMHKRLAKAYE